MSITNFKRMEPIGPAYIDVNTVTGTSYNITTTDIGDMIKFTTNDTNGVTVNLFKDSLEFFPVGTSLTFIQMGTGTVKIAPQADVVIRQEAGATISSTSLGGGQGIIRTRAQYSRIQLIKIGDNEWLSDGFGIYVQESEPLNPQANDLWMW